MRDRFFNLRKSRDQSSTAEFLETPSAVLATLGASAVVCATILVVLVTKVAPIARLVSLEEMPIAITTPQTTLASLQIPNADPGAPDVVFEGPSRLMPTSLPQMTPGNDYVLAAPDMRVEPAARVIAGRPPVEAVPRPARIVALAASIRSFNDPANVEGVRPSLRPYTAAPDIAVASASTANAVLASLRPSIRPADLEIISPAVQVARAPAGQAEITLAALPSPDSGPAFDRNANACTSRLSREIPRRSGNAAGGTAFITTLASASGTSRDAAVAREVMRGNVPNFLRDLAPVSFSGVLPNGRSAQITICVTPDYLAVGSDRDFVRVPLGLSAAGQIAEAFNMMLPTTRMVDAIYAQADLRLSPSPMDPTNQMSSTNYFLRHNATVEGQRANAGGRLGMLVSGHKKDVVLTNRLARAPGRVAIYGWHRRGGNPIQPLSTVHGASYADYSHGIRLVSRTAFVNGRAYDLEDLLMDGTYAGLLNSEGAIGQSSIQLASR